MVDALVQFAQPFGFWLGLAVLGVLAAHLVRRRARRHEVAFLPLWAAALEARRTGFGAGLVRHLDLLLMLLACSAVALAAGAPFVPGDASSVRDLVLVLDGGVELRAADREERLRKVAAAEIRRRAPGTRMVVIGVRDEGPALWAGTDKKKALHAVAAHRPGWLPSREAGAIALAREAAVGLRNPDLVLCKARPIAPEGFRFRAVGGPIENVGIATLEVLEDPEGRGRIARLGLRGRGKITVFGTRVDVGPRGEMWDRQWEVELDGSNDLDADLPSGGVVRFSVTATAAGADRFDNVTPEFAIDDAVHLILPERRVPRVLVVADKPPSPFLTAALQALQKTGVIAGPLGKTTPAHAAAAARSYDLLIFDRCAPVAPLAGTRAVFLAPPPGVLPFKVGALTQAPTLFDIESKHPLLLGFDLSRIPPRAARAILGGEAVAHAAPGPVLATGPSWIALGFDPDRCVLAASPAYPLFLRNCIVRLADVLPPAAPEFYAMGEPAPTTGIAHIPRRVLGQTSESFMVRHRLLGPPGFWQLGGQVFGVSLLTDGLDLSGPGGPSDPLAHVGTPAVADRPLSALFAAAALMILLVAWWLCWR